LYAQHFPYEHKACRESPHIAFSLHCSAPCKPVSNCQAQLPGTQLRCNIVFHATDVKVEMMRTTAFCRYNLASLSALFILIGVLYWQIYQLAQRELLPTPTKSHYTFNLRDMSKVFQVILWGRVLYAGWGFKVQCMFGCSWPTRSICSICYI